MLDYIIDILSGRVTMIFKYRYFNCLKPDDTWENTSTYGLGKWVLTHVYYEYPEYKLKSVLWSIYTLTDM